MSRNTETHGGGDVLESSDLHLAEPEGGHPSDGAAGVNVVQQALRVLVVGTVVGAIVVFDPRPGQAGARPKLLLVLAGAAVAAVLLAVTAVVAGRRALRKPLFWPVGALVAWTAVCAMTSPYPDTAAFGASGATGLAATAAFAVLFFASAAVFGPRQVMGAIAVLCGVAGVAVLAFGVGQAVDRLVSLDRGWDWARPEIAPQTIGSTLGNPNHLGGLIAMLVPLAIVLAVRMSGPPRRLAIAGIALALAELAVTASRAAWLGTVVGVGVLGVLFRRELRRSWARAATAVAAGAGLMVLAVVVLGALGVTKVRPGALARTGAGSTLDLRLELWQAALRMAGDRPLTGVGPDAFAVAFPDFASLRFDDLYGPFTIANGAHNVFLNTLAELGVVGLVAFAAVLIAGARRMAAGWAAPPPDHAVGTSDAARAPIPEHRLVLGGVAAALVAFVVQAGLNTQTVALSVLFWVLLGFGVAVGSGVTEEHR